MLITQPVKGGPIHSDHVLCRLAGCVEQRIGRRTISKAAKLESGLLLEGTRDTDAGQRSSKSGSPNEEPARISELPGKKCFIGRPLQIGLRMNPNFRQLDLLGLQVLYQAHGRVHRRSNQPTPSSAAMAPSEQAGPEIDRMSPAFWHPRSCFPRWQVLLNIGALCSTMTPRIHQRHGRQTPSESGTINGSVGIPDWRMRSNPPKHGSAIAA